MVSHVEFSRDGKYLIAGLNDKTARVWSTRTGRQLLMLKGHDDAVAHASFSPDGRLIITSSRETVRVWDAKTQRDIAIFKAPDSIYESEFSPDGRLVASASFDFVRVWRVFGSLEELIDHACKVAPRFLPSEQLSSFSVNPTSIRPACQR
jgi:WD40 repeat protein